MTKTFNLIGSALWLLAAPGTVAGYIPWLITRWHVVGILSAAGVAAITLMVVSFAGLIETFLRFALEGDGTPAPVMPTKKLVVRGTHRFVRNPMYLFVLGLIFGQALLFASLTLALYGAAVWFGFHIFIIAFEEPRLALAFGAEYEAYRRNVGRWLPRFAPSRSN